MYDPFVFPKTDFKNILLLSYYKNMLLHLFLHEAETACVMVSFGD